MRANPGNRTYRCSDGEITVHVQKSEQWRGLAVSIGRPELAYEGNWYVVRGSEADGPAGRVLEEHFAEDTAEVWKQRLEANGVPCSVGGAHR